MLISESNALLLDMVPPPCCAVCGGGNKKARLHGRRAWVIGCDELNGRTLLHCTVHGDTSVRYEGVTSDHGQELASKFAALSIVFKILWQINHGYPCNRSKPCAITGLGMTCAASSFCRVSVYAGVGNLIHVISYKRLPRVDEVRLP